MEPSRRKKPRLLYPIPALLLALALILLFLLSSIRVCEFAGSSMAPTIHDGDILLFRSLGYTPRQGDIVLLKKPGFPPPPRDAVPVVKRVIATGGQHVRVDYAANAVYVDGVALEEPYIPEPMADMGYPELTLLDVTVPENSVYVLGDNRNHSSDSRHEALGCVPVECVLGGAFHIFSP